MADVMARVGFTGDYLRQKETSQRLRAGEVFMPEIATRLSWEAWAADGRDEVGRASQRAAQIVAAADERGPVLADRARETLREIVTTALARRREADSH
jgi:trimethylamine:corrinoid methyltransferase-like protein